MAAHLVSPVSSSVPSAPRSEDPIGEARRQWVAHGWDAAADGMALVTSIARVQQLLMERIDAVLRPLDLSFARYEVLMLLTFSSAGQLPMSRMGSLLQVHPTSVTSAVDRLERQGFVRRTRNADDRRQVLTSITDEGRAVAARATEGLNREVFERPGIDGDDLHRLFDLLSTVRASAGDPTT